MASVHNSMALATELMDKLESAVGAGAASSNKNDSLLN